MVKRSGVVKPPRERNGTGLTSDCGVGRAFERGSGVSSLAIASGKKRRQILTSVKPRYHLIDEIKGFRLLLDFSTSAMQRTRNVIGQRTGHWPLMR